VRHLSGSPCSIFGEDRLKIEGARHYRLHWIWCDQSITDTHTHTQYTPNHTHTHMHTRTSTYFIVCPVPWTDNKNVFSHSRKVTYNTYCTWGASLMELPQISASYIFRNYSHRPTVSRWHFVSLFIHFFPVGSKMFYFCQSDVSAVQGHPRSLNLVPIESTYVTSY